MIYCAISHIMSIKFEYFVYLAILYVCIHDNLSDFTLMYRILFPRMKTFP